MNSVAAAEAAMTRWTGDAMQSRLRKRYRSERLFKLLGFAAVGISLGFLAFLLGTMLWKGAGGLSLEFLTASDSTDPATAGVWGALKGSFLTIVVTMALAFPVGVLSAIYLEEFAARNRWTDMIEVSINNLAAVPSIIFGLLGLAVFLNFMHLPRSAPLVGGLTLALMTMPVIVIAGRNAIQAVPPSIREAALGVGASKMQVVFHHVLPLALPGILTGTIIGMARALGETAPLLMIGMRAFIAVPPSGITDPSSVLPVQIFLWSDEVDRAFVEKTSAAIIVLLVFMLMMNAIAIYLRNRFEQRW
jgi:phosphate transport system permease protein